MANFTQLGFSFDQAKCTGCKACQIACKDKNDLPVGVHWRRVVEYSGGDWIVNEGEQTVTQNVFSYYTSLACNHCQDALCIEVCPSRAMHRTDNGIVTVDPDICIGCRYCEMACSYGSPQFDQAKGVMTKCDFCLDRIAAGGEPACVAACPTRALGFGEITDLRAQNPGGTADFAPLPASNLTRPNLVVTLHPEARPTGSTVGHVANPKEI